MGKCIRILPLYVSLQAVPERDTASSEHSIVLIFDSDSTNDSESTDDDLTIRLQREGQSAMKDRRPAERNTVLEKLHLNLEDDVKGIMSGCKLGRRSPDDTLKGMFGIIYLRITEILQSQRNRLIMWAVTQGKMGVPPFKSHLDQIRQCKDIDALFDLVGFNEAWLNTGSFMDVICAASCPARDSAKYCLRFYHAIVREVCREIFLLKLPETCREQLRTIKLGYYRSLIKVTYKKELKNFSLTELLENREYLHRLLKIPLCLFDYLKAEPTRSTTVYWKVDATYTAHVILDVRQGQIFWSLMEQGIIDFHIEGSTQLSLRGPHIPGLIKNALLKGQNLIKLTQVCVCVFHMRCIIMYNRISFTALLLIFYSDIQPAIPCSSCSGRDTPFTQGEQTYI